jgi:hypothetical protein
MATKQPSRDGSFWKQALYFVITLAILIPFILIIAPWFGYSLGQSVSRLLHLPN